VRAVISPNEEVYRFDRFELDVVKRVLLRDGEIVRLTSKRFDILLTLVRNSQRIVDKDELMSEVWSDTVVEESNLTHNISALRRALGERPDDHRFIVTIPGQGYRFVAEVIGAADLEDEEIVYERTRSHLVIEEETRADEDASQALPPKLQILPAGEHSAKERIGLHEQSRAIVPVDPTRRVWVMTRWRSVGLGLAGALLAVAAVWIYQLRSKDDQPPSAPARQITMRRFAPHGGVPFMTAISPDGKTLVYCQRLKGQFSLWVGQIETNSSLPLIQQEDLPFENLVFGPDGSTVYFNVEGGNRAQPMLARMPALGGVMTELIPGVLGPPTFSPDGKRMAFLGRDGETRKTAIIVADAADGKNQRTLLTAKPGESFASEGLAWLPNGKSIVFSAHNEQGRDEILAVNVADGIMSRICDRDFPEVHNLVGLPDGSGIIVLGNENVGERLLRIWLVSYSGEARQITTDLNVFLQTYLSISRDGKLAVVQAHYNSEIWIAPHGDATRSRRVLQGVAPRYEGIDGLAWAPDGRLLYTAYVGDSQVIWSITSEGTDLRQLTPNKPNTSDKNICATADGRYVVFESNRSGSVEIWRVNSDGSNLKQLTTGGHNSLPNLSGDGRWIIYRAVRDGKAGLWRISIDGGEPASIKDISSRVTQVSPDGFYVASMSSSSRRLLVVPVAGGEPVKSFPLPETVLRSKARQQIRWTPDGRAIFYRGAPEGLWRQQLNQSQPELVKGFEGLAVRQLAWSFDGKNLAYTDGPTTQEIILIEGFR
jgi:DNA-binding winged helix-turn-helix (wHTH) protein/Tol biopolymer transport system component